MCFEILKAATLAFPFLYLMNYGDCFLGMNYAFTSEYSSHLECIARHSMMDVFIIYMKAF